MSEERFDVIIVNTKTGEAVAVIGENLNERQAERREMTGVARTNIGDFFVGTYPAGKFKKGDTITD